MCQACSLEWPMKMDKVLISMKTLRNITLEWIFCLLQPLSSQIHLRSKISTFRQSKSRKKLDHLVCTNFICLFFSKSICLLNFPALFSADFNGGENGYAIETDENVTDEDDLNDSSQKPIIMMNSSFHKPNTTTSSNNGDWRTGNHYSTGTGNNYSGSSSLSSFSYSPRSNNSSVSSHGKRPTHPGSGSGTRDRSCSGNRDPSTVGYSPIQQPRINSNSTTTQNGSLKSNTSQNQQIDKISSDSHRWSL